MSLNQLPSKLLRLQKTKDGGQALFTTTPIKPGQVVLVDTPVLVYPSSLGCIRIFCCCCFRVLPSKLLHCPHCNEACFCSAQCLEQSHPSLICHAMPTLLSSTRTWSDDILFLLAAYSLPTNKLLQLLTLDSDSSFPEESIEKLHSELASLVHAEDVSMYFTLENTTALISKKKKNSFALKNPKNPEYESCGVAGARAYGLYLWASMLNHNCIPNVCRFHYVDAPNRQNNTSFVFRAVDEIKEGLEIFTSYVGVAMGYKERQNRLIEDFGIECRCTRCKIESQWKENNGENEGSEEKNEEETTEGIGEMNKEEDTEKNNEEGTDEETEKTNEEGNKEETEEKYEEMNEEESEENNEENNEEETEEQTDEMNEEESEENNEENNAEETEEQTDEMIEEESEENNEEETEEQTDEMIEEESEENNEENNEEETEEQTDEVNEEESEEDPEECSEEHNEEEVEIEMLEGGDDNSHLLINKYIERHVCTNCGGFLAPTKPSQDGMAPAFMECNGCGNHIEYEPGDPLVTALCNP